MLAKAKRDEQETLAGNRYNFVYTYSDQVTASTVKSCITQLQEWHRLHPGCDMEVVFNSPGGNVIDGLSLFDFIQYLRVSGHHITTSTIGMAASMAGILLQAGDVRIMGQESWLLIHEASFAAVGKFGEIEDTVEWVRKIQKRVLRIFAERSQLSEKQIGTRWKRKDWWIDAEDALKMGFIDEIRARPNGGKPR